MNICKLIWMLKEKKDISIRCDWIKWILCYLWDQHAMVNLLLSLRLDLKTKSSGKESGNHYIQYSHFHVSQGSFSFEGYVLKIAWLFLIGLIRLRSNPPPKLQGVEYILNITATDDNASGGPQSLSTTAQVIVGVDDVNNNKPIFEKVLCICFATLGVKYQSQLENDCSIAFKG